MGVWRKAMSNSVSRTDQDVWVDFKDAYRAYYAAAGELFSPGVDRVGIIRNALRNADRHVAITVLSDLPIGELEQVFEELVFLASFSHGPIQHIRDQILRLPHDWVLSRIESVAEPFLANGTYDEYRRFLELYSQLDLNLVRRLAERAIAHLDPDIREAGDDYLTRTATSLL